MKKIALFSLLAVAAAAASAHEHPTAAAASKEFERVKALAGVWTGKSSEAGDLRVEYSVTAGGSAVLEKLFPGTPHEMVSMYYADGGKLAMTHYCAMGNHPEMRLKKASADRLDFELAKGSPLAKVDHMHSLSVAFSGPDKITQTWTSVEGGKTKQTVIELERAK